MSRESLENLMASEQDDKWKNLIYSSRLMKTSREIYNNQVLGKECIITHFGYAGFDILAFRDLIRKKVDSVEDLVFLVILFLVRGNNINRIMDSTNSVKVVERLKKLTTKLSIKPKASGRTLRVTLSRIAISFPEIVAIILTECPEIPGPIGIEEIRQVLETPDFPSLARQPALCCFLPKKNPETMKMLNVFMVCNMMMLEVININNQKWYHMPEEAKASTTKTSQLNAFNSALFSENEREKWCNKLGITVGGKYSAIWTQAATVAKNALEKKYMVSF